MTTQPPDYYMSTKKGHPEFVAAVEALGETVGQAGPLDETSRQLIQLAAAVAIRSEGAVHSHVKRALDAGANADQVRHAIILLTSTVGFPSVMAALSWADDILEG